MLILMKIQAIENGRLSVLYIYVMNNNLTF